MKYTSAMRNPSPCYASLTRMSSFALRVLISTRSYQKLPQVTKAVIGTLNPSKDHLKYPEQSKESNCLRICQPKAPESTDHVHRRFSRRFFSESPNQSHPIAMKVTLEAVSRFIRSPCTEVRERRAGWRKKEKREDKERGKRRKSPVSRGEKTKGEREGERGRINHMDLSSNVVRK